jgi:hypothetical protein
MDFEEFTSTRNQRLSCIQLLSPISWFVVDSDSYLHELLLHAYSYSITYLLAEATI